jgi:hypothetical protein
MEDFIVSFERLSFRTEGMYDAFFRECFISSLKDKIRAHVLMAQPGSWVEATKRAKESHQVVYSQNRKPSFIPRPKLVNPTTPSTPLKIQKLTQDEMVECQLKGLFYNCDDPVNPTTPSTPLKIQKLTQDEMVECQLKGLCYIYLATSVKNKIVLWQSLRRFQKKMKKLPLCLNHLNSLT